jgi:hypothetical protein
MSALLSIVLILFFLIIIVSIMRSYAVGPWDYDEEVTTTTTTTTTTVIDTPAPSAAQATTGLNINGFPIVGMITRQFEGKQPFVIDPIDGDKVFLNTSDDIYEDGEGKWWGLQ